MATFQYAMLPYPVPSPPIYDARSVTNKASDRVLSVDALFRPEEAVNDRSPLKTNLLSMSCSPRTAISID